MVNGESDGASESGDSYFTEAVDAGVGVDANDEVEAPGVVSDGEGSDLCDFHMWVAVCAGADEFMLVKADAEVANNMFARSGVLWVDDSRRSWRSRQLIRVDRGQTVVELRDPGSRVIRPIRNRDPRKRFA